MSKSFIQMSIIQETKTFTANAATGECGDTLTATSTMVYKAGECIPAGTANTWVKVPLYECGSGAELKGVTYKNDDCSTETDQSGTATLEVAGACADNGDSVGQTVTCMRSSANGEFVQTGKTFMMVTNFSTTEFCLVL